MKARCGWGSDNGVTRVETPSPVSYFNQSDGLGGGVQTAARIDGRLYLGLQSGAAYLVPRSPDGKMPAHFEHLAGHRHAVLVRSRR